MNSSDFNTPKVKSASKFGNNLKLILHLAWTIYFWIKIGNTSEDVCSGSSWFWGRYAKYFYLIHVITMILTQCTQQPQNLKDHSPTQTPLNFKKLENAFYPLMIGSLFSYWHSDECPDLSGITTVHFIYCMLVFCLMLFSVCCVICMKTVLSERPNTEQSSTSRATSFWTGIREGIKEEKERQQALQLLEEQGRILNDLKNVLNSNEK